MNSNKLKIFSTILVLLTISLVSCDKEVSVSPVETFSIESGSIFISSNPSGAEIFVDGKPVGLFTPDTVKWLTDGDHEFVLKLDRFLDYSFVAETNNNTVNLFSYDYFSDPINFGSVSITSSPTNATIFLNDSLLASTTPFTATNLIPNSYKIKVTFPEHRDDSTQVVVLGGKHANVSISLSDTSNWVIFNNFNSPISNNTVSDIFIDNNDLVWFATQGSGIVQNKGKSWNYITTDNSNLPHNRVNTLTFSNSTGWITTINGLAKIENNLITTFANSAGRYISDAKIDNAGNTWVATEKGLVKIVGNTWTVYNTGNSDIPANFITAVEVDQNNHIWIGTNDFGVAEFDGDDTWFKYTKIINGLPGKSVKAIIADKENNIYAGFAPGGRNDDSRGGVAKFVNGEWIILELGLVNKMINSFYVSSSNLVWISTRAGLVKYKNETDFEIFNATNSPIPINDVLSIHPDSQNNLWISTNGGGIIKYKNFSVE